MRSFFFRALFGIAPACCMWMRLRGSFRLRSGVATTRMRAVQPTSSPVLFRRSRRMPLIVHRFEETINGRPYSIEVSLVGQNQWRAQIARISGGSRALMPFYGRTPDEAAQHLSRWLSLAHGRTTTQV
jgi:hypothetical protein